MATLRREVIEIVERVLNDYLKTGYSYLGEEIPSELCEKLADSILELRAFQTDEEKPMYAFDMEKASVEWKIVAGEQISQSDIDRNVLIQEAQNSFEQELHFMTLPWASTKDWEKFLQFVVSEYEKDREVWRKYQTWRVGDGKYQGVLSNNKIAQKPLLFRDADFPTFLAHTGMYKKTEDVPVTYNDDGMPDSW